MTLVKINSVVYIRIIICHDNFFLCFRSQEEESIALNECIQLCFHQSCRHHILLVYLREILILDLEINQTVGIIALDRTGSPFSRVCVWCLVH
jgi:hypothetical protein